MNDVQTAIFFGAIVAVLAYFAGAFVGRVRHQALVSRHIDRASDYRRAVDDLDRWCGHEFAQARLIARHLKAVGEGEGLNAGSPAADEPCTISGLREQLRRLVQI